MTKDWGIAIIICAAISFSLFGAFERTPFEADKSFTRTCSGHWLNQEFLVEIREVYGKSSVVETCDCITGKMMAFGASKDEYAALIIWMTQFDNTDYKDYYKLYGLEGYAFFPDALSLCTNTPLEEIETFGKDV